MNKPSHQLLIARDLRAADARRAADDRRFLAEASETPAGHRPIAAGLRRISAVAVSLFR